MLHFIQGLSKDSYGRIQQPDDVSQRMLGIVADEKVRSPPKTVTKGAGVMGWLALAVILKSNQGNRLTKKLDIPRLLLENLYRLLCNFAFLETTLQTVMFVAYLDRIGMHTETEVMRDYYSMFFSRR